MATLTMTVRNTLRLYGIEPHNKWGTMVWGSDTWGQRDVEWTATHAYYNTLTVDSTNRFKVYHQISESISIGTVISREFPSRVSENLFLTSRIASVYRVNNGWFVKKGDTINALSFPVSNFTQVSDPTTSWTVAVAPTTIWNQL